MLSNRDTATSTHDGELCALYLDQSSNFKIIKVLSDMYLFQQTLGGIC
jgi:hypothetical protein